MNLTGFSCKVSEDGSKLLLLKNSNVVESLPIIPASEEHRSLVLSTWVKSYLPTAKKHMPKEMYLANEPLVAETHWDKTLIVSSNDDSYAVHAWVCGSPGKLWMVYVPPELRGIGLARELIKLASGIRVDAARPWPFRLPPRGFDWKTNPYLLQQSPYSGT